MKTRALVLAGIAFVMLSSTQVFASTVFNFSFTGNNSVTGIPAIPFSGSGQFTANQIGSTNQYEVVGVTGTTNGQIIGNLVPVGGYGFNDNLLFFGAGDTSAVLDNNGVSYQLVDGTYANLFLSTNGGGAQTLFGFSNGLIVEAQNADILITAAPPAVPEPSTLVLLGTGLFGMVGAARRRFTA